MKNVKKRDNREVSDEKLKNVAGGLAECDFARPTKEELEVLPSCNKCGKNDFVEYYPEHNTSNLMYFECRRCNNREFYKTKPPRYRIGD